jgi:diguanylate cyclase (GGDEF)-like protein
MSLEYEINKRVKDTTAVLDEYSSWFMTVVRCLSYPEHAEGQDALMLPGSYENWIDNMKNGGLAEELSSKLDLLQDELNREANKLTRSTLSLGQRPDYKSYNHLVTLYEEFTHHIRRVNKDFLLEDGGIDQVTGLRSAEMFYQDIKREMERLSRHGRPFSLVLVRIDYMEKIKATGDQSLLHSCLQNVALMIKRSLRSFDDAYRLDNDEFLLCLKQANITGGIMAMERLKTELEQENITFDLEEKTVPLGLSSCIAEPLPEDDVDELIKNLRYDLDLCARDDGAVLEYFEMSPLERYVKEIHD